MKRFFKWLLLLIALLSVGITIILYNPGLVKGPIERYLSNVAGYPISLDGDLELDTGRLIEISAEGISISGPDWANHPQLIGIEHLKLSLQTASLFKKIKVIESLHVEGLVMNMETDADGHGNWITANASEAPVSENDKKGTSPVVIFDFVQLSNSTLRFLNGKKGFEYVFVIDSLDHAQQSDGLMHTSLKGLFNESPVVYTHTVGPYENLLNGKDVGIDVSAKLGELVISGKGLIDDLLEPRSPEFNLQIQGPNIDRVTAMLGAEDLGSGGFSLRAKGGDINGIYEADLSGEIGDISLSANAEMSDLSSMHELDINLALNGPSLGSFTRSLGIENWPDKPFSLKGDAKRIGRTLDVSGLTLSIGGTNLALDALLTNFPEFDASRVKLSVTGDDVEQFRDLLGIPGVATGPFEIVGRLDVSPQNLELLNVELSTSMGKATLSGTLGPGPGYIGTRLQLHAEGGNANTLMSAFEIDALPEQPFTLNTRVEIVEDGVNVERGVLVTIDDDRLELGGFVALNPGAQGTDLEMSLSGQDLAQMLRRLVGDTKVPARPYNLAGRVRIVEDGLELENASADFEGIKLGTNGLIRFDDRLLGTSVDFQLSGSDLTALSSFEAIGNSMDIFIPGQSYGASGRFKVETGGFQLQDISGRIGKTNFIIDGLISNQPDLAGTQVRFSMEGPGLHTLLAERDEVSLHTEAFDSSGEVFLTADSLGIKGFHITTNRAQAKIDLELDWPVSRTGDARFDIDIQGDDIRLFFPRKDLFEPELAAYKINAVGHKKGPLISLKQFDAGVGNLQITMQGKVIEESSDGQASINIIATSEDLSALGSFKGERLPAMGLDLKADFSGNADRFVIRNFNGSLGKSRLEGELDVSFAGPIPEIKLTANSDYIDVRPFQKSSAVEEEEEAASAKSERLIPATPLPLDKLNKVNASLRINITEIEHLKDSIHDLVLDVDLTNGNLSIPRFTLKGTRGESFSSLSIQPTGGNSADVKYDLTAKDLVLNLSGQPEDTLQNVPAFDVDIHVNGTGGNLQELAGSINGSAYMGTEGGTLEGVNLSLLDTFILDEIFSLILPKSKKSDDLDLTCAATILKMTDGVVETDPALAFITGKISVVAKGTLDLKTEKMHFNFNATPNNALKISASELLNPYILVGGTLANPEVGLDPGKVLVHGGAAIGTAGLSVLAKGLLDRAGNVAPLCEKIQKQHQQPPKKSKQKGKKR